MNNIQYCAPINDSNEDDKNQFYGSLQPIILSGDLNANARTDSIRYEDILGRMH